MIRPALLCVALGVLLSACATGSRAPRCSIQVMRLDQWQVKPGDVRVAYLVRGEAGVRGKTWLAAKPASGDYVSGAAREVGPGPFQERVELRLTGRVPRYVAVLQVNDRRCRDEVDAP